MIEKSTVIVTIRKKTDWNAASSERTNSPLSRQITIERVFQFARFIADHDASFIVERQVSRPQ